MFKITATFFSVSENRSIFIEQTFTKKEKELAIHVAGKIEATAGYTNVRLHEVKVTGTVPVKFGQALVKPVKVVAVKKPRVTKKVVVASVNEFELPAPAPKKRVTKRERAFGSNAKVVA